jgi:hypothetical protein
VRRLVVILGMAAGSSKGDRGGAPAASGSAPAPAARAIDAAAAGPLDAAVAGPTDPAPIVAPAGPVTFVEARLGTRAPRDDDKLDAVVWSPTGRAVEWVDSDGKREHLVVNGVAQRAFDHVENPEFAPDGVTPRYIANDGGTVDPGDRTGFVHGGSYRIVTGDQLGPPADWLMFVHDADQPDHPFTYVAQRGFAQTLVVGGHAGPAVQDVSILNLRWLPGGGATYQAKAGGEQHVVIGDDVGPGYAGTTRPRVSRDGVVAYGARDASGASHVVVGRTPGARYDDLDGVDMSPDGVVTYEGARGDARFAVIGTRELGPYDRVMEFAYSRTGGHIAYKARKGDKWFVVIDGVHGPSFAGIGGELAAAVWSDDAKHVAYVAHTGGDVEGPDLVVRDGARDTAYDDVKDLTWSRDGRHLAYVARRHDDAHVMVVDGAAGPPMAEVGPPSFDGAGRVVYEARRETPAADGFPHIDWCVVRGSAPACYDDVGEPGMIAGDQDANFTISPNGKHLAFRARKAEHWMIVVDGREGAPADQLWPPRWSTDGTQLGYGAREGDALWWRVIPIATP